MQTLLDEMSRRHNGEAEYRKLQENYSLIEAKCEQLQEDLANTRFGIGHTDFSLLSLGICSQVFIGAKSDSWRST